MSVFRNAGIAKCWELLHITASSRVRKLENEEGKKKAEMRKHAEHKVRRKGETGPRRSREMKGGTGFATASGNTS